MIPGDRLFCALVENMHVGDMFTDWPLHVTIVPWFRADTTSEDLGRELSRRLTDLAPFVVSVAGETRMGHRGRRKVNLIVTPTPLQTIEKEARALLHEKSAWIVDETTRRQRPFVPHVTHQKSGRLQEGDTFVCNSVYIVEQKGDCKEIVSRIEV